MADGQQAETHMGPTGGGYRKAFECRPEQLTNDFIATNEWQEILPGQIAPPGLKVNMDMKTGKRYAKLIDKSEPLVEDVEYIKTQVAAGVDLNTQDSNGSTLLHRAVEKDDLDCVKLLVESKADANKMNKRFSPLHLAIKKGNFDITNYLVKEAKVNVGATSKSGQSPLHLAAFQGNMKIVELLATKKNVDKQNRDQATALHVAGEQGHLPVIEYLVLKLNADVEVKNYEEKEAADVAEDFEHIEVAHYLRDVISQRAMNDLFGEAGLDDKPKKQKFKPTGENKAKKGKKGKGGKGKGKAFKKNKQKKEEVEEEEEEDEFFSSGSGGGSGLTVSDAPSAGTGSGMVIVDKQPIRHVQPTPVVKKPVVESSSEEEESSDDESGSDSDDLD